MLYNSMLELTHPNLVAEWHIKNKPIDVTAGCNKKVWWKCNKAEDHEWEAAISTRTRLNGNGCPCCRGLKVVKSNSLATVNPSLASQWHLTKNGNFTPNDVVLTSNKKVWWKCNKAEDHEWEATIANRRKHNCPFCSGRKPDSKSSLSALFPDLAKEWHPTKNYLTPIEVGGKSGKKIWWVCSKQHEWQTKVYHRTSGSNCPFCKLSRGEIKIEKILKEEGVKYKHQFKINACKDKLPLPFDFALWVNNRLLLIEYQGKQHYKVTGFGSNLIKAKDNFEIIKRHDSIKKNYCFQNNIPLLEVPFWKHKSIEKMIKKFIQELDTELKSTTIN